MPYALDETLRDVADLRPFPNVSALIVKPTLLGGRQDITYGSEWSIPLDLQRGL